MAAAVLKPLPTAYAEQDPAPAPGGYAHYVHLEGAQPSGVMKAFGAGWRAFKRLVMLSILACLILAYPVAILAFSHVDDRPVAIPAGESWAVPGIGVSIHKIARELEGVGWAANRAAYHPQARLTALPAWQAATSDALSQHVMLISELAPYEGQPDRDLAAAARLLVEVPGEAMRPRLTAAAEALNRFDTRASRGLAVRLLPEDSLPHELALFARWAAEDRAALAAEIRSEPEGWGLAGRAEVAAFYQAKARAHVAHEMLVANWSATASGEPALADEAARLAAGRLEAALERAARMKPVFVMRPSGSAFLLPDHLASMAFFLYEAEEAALELAGRMSADGPSEGVPGAVAEELAGLN